MSSFEDEPVLGESTAMASGSELELHDGWSGSILGVKSSKAVGGSRDCNVSRDSRESMFQVAALTRSCNASSQYIHVEQCEILMKRLNS